MPEILGDGGTKVTMGGDSKFRGWGVQQVSVSMGWGVPPPILNNPETVNKEGVHLERTILTIIKKCSTTVSFIFKKQ